MERIPKPGEFYRHLNNTLYQIITIARNTETGEQLVIYQELSGNFSIYAGPLSRFLGEVIPVKRPEAGEPYRPEWTEDMVERTGEQSSWRSGLADEDEVNPWLERFLDAEGYDQRLSVLRMMLGKVGQKEVDSIYLALDIAMPSKAGDVDSQLRGIIKHLETKKRYDGSRLR